MAEKKVEIQKEDVQSDYVTIVSDNGQEIMVHKGTLVSWLKNGYKEK